MSWQLSCHDMCKILTWSEYYFSHQSKSYSYNIWIMSSWTLCEIGLWSKLRWHLNWSSPTHFINYSELITSNPSHVEYFGRNHNSIIIFHIIPPQWNGYRWLKSFLRDVKDLKQPGHQQLSYWLMVFLEYTDFSTKGFEMTSELKPTYTFSWIIPRLITFDVTKYNCGVCSQHNIVYKTVMMMIKLR